MMFREKFVFIICLLVMFWCVNPQQITELPKEVPAVDAVSALPKNVQINGTNSSSLSAVDNAGNLSSTAEPPITQTNSSGSKDTNDVTRVSPEEATTNANTSPTSESIANTSSFENVTFEVNSTTTLNFEDVFQNETFEFSNSSSTEPPTDLPSSGTESPDYENDLSVRQTMFLDDYCSCDIEVGSCDIGCCCDQDCTSEDRRAFDACLAAPRPLAGDSRYCLQKWVLQRHNTEYTVDTTNPSLFCIVTDNLVQRTSFPPLKVVRTPEDFQKLSQTLRRGLALPDDKASSRPPAPLPANKPYQRGDWVWGVSYEGTLFPIGLPSAMFSSACEAKSKLKYLSASTTECQRQVRVNFKGPIHKSLLPSSYTNFFVLMQPSLLFEQNEEITTTTSAPTKSPTTFPSTSTPTTMTDASTHFPATTNTQVNNSFGTTDPSNSTSTATVTVGPKTSERTSATNATPSSNTNAPTASVELTASATTSSENEVLRNASANSTKAQLKSTDSFVRLEDSPLVFNDSLLCKVRVTLCFTSHETVCYDPSVQKSPLTQCDVVTEVNYVIYHNGSEGIKSVTAKVTLKNICSENLSSKSSRDSSDENFQVHLNVKQKFTVKYRWAQDEGVLVRERSGRPGYMRGKPLLLGRKVHNVTEEGFSVEAIAMNPDFMRGLTVLKASPTGDCTVRTPVLFGENIQAHCGMQVAAADVIRNCSHLRETVRTKLLGDVLSDGEDDLMVAMYGDSDVLLSSQWVPLLRTSDTSRAESGDAIFEENRCSDLVVSVKLEVAFALQGSLANPQAKVVGALLTEGPLRPSPPVSCMGPFCQRESFDDRDTPVEDTQQELEGSGDLMVENQNSGFTDQESSGQSLHNEVNEPRVQKLVIGPNTSTKATEDLEFQRTQFKTSAPHTVTIQLSTTVIFFDVTEPSEPAFPDVPHLDIKLPENFFYPLVPSNSGSNLRAYTLFHICCFCVLFLILQSLTS